MSNYNELKVIMLWIKVVWDVHIEINTLDVKIGTSSIIVHINLRLNCSIKIIYINLNVCR